MVGGLVVVAVVVCVCVFLGGAGAARLCCCSTEVGLMSGRRSCRPWHPQSRACLQDEKCKPVKFDTLVWHAREARQKGEEPLSESHLVQVCGALGGVACTGLLPWPRPPAPRIRAAPGINAS